MSVQGEALGPGWLGRALRQGLFQWVVAAILAALVAAGGVFWGEIRARWYTFTHPLPPPSNAEDYVVLIADLASDDQKRTQTRRLARAISDEFAAIGFGQIQILRYPRTLSVGDRATVSAEREAEMARAREWLSQQHADVLVWGSVLRDNRQIDVHFIHERGAEGSGAAGLTSLTYRREYASALAPAFAAIFAAEAEPAFESGVYTADLLRPLIQRLRPLAEGPPQWLTGEARGSIQFHYAAMNSAYGGQAGDAQALETAVAAYLAALREYARDRAPLDWAKTQNHLGVAYFRLGLLEAGTGRFDAAIAAYRAALQERPRARVPVQWATTQNNLGGALFALGERETGTARLEEAVAAYRAALQERTRDRAPLEWAATQTNLGVALAAIGGRQDGTLRLEEAAATYRNALTVYTRTRAPLNWAATQNNLGNTLWKIGLRESGVARLEEAVAAYRAALQVRTRAQLELQWAATQYNLGNALRALGERETGTARLEEAVLAYRAALEVRSRSRVPLRWAQTTESLALTLESMANKGANPRQNIEEAIGLLEAALVEFRRASPPYQVGIQRAERKLQRLRAQRHALTTRSQPISPTAGHRASG